MLVRFLVDVEVGVGVVGVVCSELWAYGSVESGVLGIVPVRIGVVAIAGVGRDGGMLPPEGGIAVEGGKCWGVGKDDHSVQ